MKILLIHHSGLIGGAGLSLMNTIDALKLAGHEVILSVPSEPVDIQKKAREHGVEPIISERRIGALTSVIPGDKVMSPRFIYRMGLIFLQAKKWNKRIEEINPDVVIMNSKLLCWMSKLPTVKKRKSICWVRETVSGSRNSCTNKKIAKLLEGYNKVVFISGYDEKLENLKRAETAVIHNFIIPFPLTEPQVLLEKKKEWGLTSGRFTVLYVGGVYEVKGFEIAVKSVLAAGNDVDLIVAGVNMDDVIKNGNKSLIKFAKKMDDYIKKNDKYNQIHLIGKQLNISPCYENSDLLMFPMQKPHQARPAFEAGYYNMPVLISNFDNIEEFIIDDFNGYKCDAKDYNAFAEKIKALKDNRELLEKLGKNNNEFVKQNHSKEVIQKQIIDEVNELIK